MRYLFIIFILLSFLQSGFSQYQPIQNQYILNPFYINPSFAGAVNGTLLSATQRSQWIEFPESPNTQTIAYQTNKGKVGLGGWVYRDTLSLHENLAGERVDSVNLFNLISKKLNASRLFVINGNDLNGVTLDPEIAANKLNVISLVLNGNQ
jgi:hypothetical protein